MSEVVALLLVEEEWRSLAAAPGADVQADGSLRYRGLPVFVVSPGPSRAVTAEEADGLQLGAS
jgi:hypothetical protein